MSDRALNARIAATFVSPRFRHQVERFDLGSDGAVMALTALATREIIHIAGNDRAEAIRLAEAIGQSLPEIMKTIPIKGDTDGKER